MAAPPNLSSRTGRRVLAARHKPYWQVIEPGGHLGYYRGVRAGSWIARQYIGGGRYAETRLGVADDVRKADGVHVLDFSTAHAKAQAWFASRARTTVHAPVSGRGRDEFDAIQAAWARERPDLDLTVMMVFLRLERANVLHQQRVAAVAQAAGLNISDLYLVLALRRSGPPYALRPTDLFRTLLVTSGAVTKQIDRLERLGLVERVRGTDDRRSSMTMLTKRGFEVADQAMSAFAGQVHALVRNSGVTAAQIAELDRHIRKIIAPAG